MGEHKTIELIKNLLDDERDALINGDFQKLSGLLKEKEFLFEKVLALETHPGEMAFVQKSLRRNQELFDEALKGIRGVANRLAEYQRVRSSLNTYDANGQRNHLSVPGSSKLERLA